MSGLKRQGPLYPDMLSNCFAWSLSQCHTNVIWGRTEIQCDDLTISWQIIIIMLTDIWKKPCACSKGPIHCMLCCTLQNATSSKEVKSVVTSALTKLRSTAPAEFALLELGHPQTNNSDPVPRHTVWTGGVTSPISVQSLVLNPAPWGWWTGLKLQETGKRNN